MNLQEKINTLEQTVDRFRLFLDAAPDATVIADNLGKIVLINIQAEQLFGYPRSELIGKPLEVLVPERLRKNHVGHRTKYVDAPIVRPMGKGRYLFGLRKNGTEFPIEISLSPIKTDDGLLISSSIRDISERLRIDELIQQSEEKYHAIFNQARDGIVLIELESGKIIDCNPEFEAITGRTHKALLKLKIWELRSAEQREEARKMFYKIKENGSGGSGELDFIHKDGRIVPVDFVSSVVTIGNKQILQSIVRDITERKHAQTALQKAYDEMEKRVEERTSDLADMNKRLQVEIEDRVSAQEELDRFFTVSLDMLCMANFDGYFVKLNPIWEETLGWTLDELMSKPYVSFIHEDDLEATIKEAEKLEKGINVIHFENRYLCKDNSYRWILWSASQDVERKMIYSVARDVTELKKEEENLIKLNIELEQAKEKAEESDRLKSAFLASMSHELRTPLNSIIGFIGIIMQGLSGPLSPEQDKQLGMAQNSARHLLELINDVLDISKIEAGEVELIHEEFDFFETVKKVVQNLKPLAEKKHLELTTHFKGDIKNICSDKRRIQQIMINMINNAIKFTDKGSVIVECGTTNGFLETRITDTGIGIKSEDLPKIFNEFQQIETGLDRKHEGTGLGLSICFKLSEMLGAKIDVESEWGKGSIFTFALPLQ